MFDGGTSLCHSYRFFCTGEEAGDAVVSICKKKRKLCMSLSSSHILFRYLSLFLYKYLPFKGWRRVSFFVVAVPVGA